MLACRLCLAGGFSDDPEQWLHTASERQLAVWQAFYKIEPFGAEFHRSAAQSSLLSQLIAYFAASVGCEEQASPMQDFMPSDWIDAKKRRKRKKLSPDESVRRAEKVIASVVPTWQNRRMD